MKHAVLILIALSLAGCTRGYWYDYESNLRADANPDLLARLQRARVICNGEVSKAVGASGIAGDRIFDGCMIQQGFEVRPQ